jgi:hypothetical protein
MKTVDTARRHRCTAMIPLTMISIRISRVRTTGRSPVGTGDVERARFPQTNRTANNSIAGGLYCIGPFRRMGLIAPGKTSTTHSSEYLQNRMLQPLATRASAQGTADDAVQ